MITIDKSNNANQLKETLLADPKQNIKLALKIKREIEKQIPNFFN